MRKMPTTKQIDELQKLIDTGTVPGINVEWDDVKDKPPFAEVATTGDYEDLSNKPSIPTKTSDLSNDSGFITNQDIPKNGVFIAIQGTTTYSELRAAYDSGNYGWFIAVWYQAHQPTVPQYAPIAYASSSTFGFRRTSGRADRGPQYSTYTQIGTNQVVSYIYVDEIRWDGFNSTGLVTESTLGINPIHIIELEADSTTLRSGDKLAQIVPSNLKLTYNDLAFLPHSVRLTLTDTGTIITFEPILVKTGINGTDCIINYTTRATGYTTWKLKAQPSSTVQDPQYANRNYQIALFELTK